MTDRTPGFRRDATILLRYRWFIIAVFAVAVAGALIVGVTNSFDYEASSRVEMRAVERRPVFGVKISVNFDDYTLLGLTERVAKRAEGVLAEQGVSVNAATLLASMSQRDVTPPGFQAFGLRLLEFTAHHGDEPTAVAYSNAWAKAYLDEAAARRDELADAHIRTLDEQAKISAGLIDEKQKALDELLRRQPDVAPVYGIDLVAERSRVVRALARLKAIQATRGSASPTELRIALEDVFPPGGAPPAADLATLIGGLGLRLTALDGEIAALSGGNAAAQQEARRLLAEAEAARKTYEAAQTEAAAARAAKPVAPVEFRPVQAADVTNSRQLSLVGLLAAAAALGLVAGVAGAFVIEFMTRNGLLPWRQRTEPASKRP